MNTSAPREHPQQRVLRRGMAQVENNGTLVAGVGLPVQLMAAIAPIAQGIAVGRLHLDDVGPEIGKLEGEHVAGDQTREIEHAQVRERAAGALIELDAVKPVSTKEDPQAMR